MPRQGGGGVNMRGVGQEEDWSGGTSCGGGDGRIHTNNFHTHMMDHNKCINRDDDTIRMLIYC